MSRIQTIAQNCFMLPKLATQYEDIVGAYVAQREYAAGHRSMVPPSPAPKPTGNTTTRRTAVAKLHPRIKLLHKMGVGTREIAKQLRISRGAVVTYVATLKDK